MNKYNLSGIFSKNDYKKDQDHNDLSGIFNYNDKKYKVGCWEFLDKNNKQYWKIAIKPNYPEINDCTGSFFKQKQEDIKSHNHPTFKGSIKFEGKDYWLAGWMNEKNGRTFCTFKLTPKEKQENKKEDNQEEIPF